MPAPGAGAGAGAGELRLLADPQFRRLRATVDMELALQLYNVYRYLLSGPFPRVSTFTYCRYAEDMIEDDKKESPALSNLRFE